MSDNVMRSDDREPNYKAAMLFHSDRADAYAADLDKANAEITRLRAQVEAADGLAKEADDCVARFISVAPALANSPPIRAFRTALATYQQAKEVGE